MLVVITAIPLMHQAKIITKEETNNIIIKQIFLIVPTLNRFFLVINLPAC